MTQRIRNTEIAFRMQQKEQELSQFLLMCHSLAATTTRFELYDVLNTTIKNIMGFNQFIVCMEDESCKGYTLFYYNNLMEYAKHKNENYKHTLEIFTSVLNSPEPLVLSRKSLDKTAVPTVIKEAFSASIDQSISCTIPSRPGKGVLFIGFCKKTFAKKYHLKLIKMLSTQLGITLTNILMYEKLEIAKAKTEDNPKPMEASKASDHMDIIGNSEPIHKLRSLIEIVSPTDSGVLISGASGTGKELVAKAIHENSARHTRPFIKVNCGAIPEHLLESEFFGHEKGSFTGAIAKNIGKFELAHQGTLFLDEIGDMPLGMQVKLLRVLQEKEIQRLGGNSWIPIDTRIIAASNKNLKAEISNGNFRSDLYYRLNVFPIDVPSLKEHTDDIEALSTLFIKKYCLRNDKSLKTIASTVLNRLKIHDWPGNVRELENVIERAVLQSPGKVIEEINLDTFKIQTSIQGNSLKPWREFERDYILTVIKFCKGKISGPNGAAELLEIPSTTLQSKMRRLGIRKSHVCSEQ